MRNATETITCHPFRTRPKPFRPLKAAPRDAQDLHHAHRERIIHVHQATKHIGHQFRVVHHLEDLYELPRVLLVAQPPSPLRTRRLRPQDAHDAEHRADDADGAPRSSRGVFHHVP